MAVHGRHEAGSTARHIDEGGGHTFNRRLMLEIMGVAAVAAASFAVAAAPRAMARKTGAGYVKWESIAKPGDTLVTAAKRLTSPAVITLPEGLFEFPAFTEGDNLYGLIIAGNFRGISGSGRGTIVQMTPNSISSASASYARSLTRSQVNNLNAIVTKGGFHAPEISQLHLRGTEQQGVYHYPILFQRSTAGVFHDVLVSGFPGGAATPPTEVGGVQFGSCTFAVAKNIEIDGRRYDQNNVPGLPVSSSLLMINDVNFAGARGSSSMHLTNFYLHDGLTNSVALWHSTNVKFYSSTFGNGINEEESGWIDYWNLKLSTNGPYHYAAANDTGNTYFVNPVWTPSTNRSANGRFTTHLFGASARAPIVRMHGKSIAVYEQDAAGHFSVVTTG